MQQNTTGVHSSSWLRITGLCGCCCILLLSVAVNGEWSEWSPWRSCSVSCGRGQKTRFRACVLPARSDGKWCPGKALQREECNMETKCPVDGGWSSWSAWSACSVSCGEGSMRRFRSCSKPIPMDGGATCQGSPHEMENCFAIKECPRDGSWSSWSRWSQCSVTCGRGGSVHRYRACNNPPPTAEGRDCEGSGNQTTQCKAPNECPVNGQWSEWSEWTECSVTCGRGDMQRRRGCDNPPPFHGGRDCDRTEAGELQTHSCEGKVKFCPVDGGWSEWSDWGSCNSPKCGSADVRALSFRQRSCNSPLPKHNGSMCQGIFLNAGFCEQPLNCRVDGNWSEWSTWECSPFAVKRTRTCDNPPPSRGGNKCKGKDVDFYPRGDESYREMCPQFPGDDEDLEEASGVFASGDGIEDRN